MRVSAVVLFACCITLFGAEYQIRLSSNPAPSDITAANELARYFGQIAGKKHTFKVTRETDVPSGKPSVVIGQNDTALKLFNLRSWKELRRDEVLYKTAYDGTLYIAGDRTRGSLYAVYELLEQEYGVRFFAPDCVIVPPMKEFRLPKSGKDYRYAPHFENRSSAYEILQKGPEDWAAQMRQNGYGKPKTAEYGGHDTLLGWCHTFHKILPISKYGKEHPEWYAEIKGKRINGYGQLCLTNKKMRRQFTANVLELLRKAPGTRFISVSQNDTEKEYCTCGECTRFVREKGNQTDLLLDFVNEIAAQVKSQFPEVQVETLAYNYTVEPPKTIRPLDNVAIRYCTIHAAAFHPVDSKVNEKVAAQMKAWKGIAPKMMVWNYVTDHHRYYQPHPNWHILADDIRFFRECGAIGLFEQGAYFAAGHISDLPEMRIYLMSKLMWNPDLDDKEILEEFARRYYGPGADSVLNYVRAMTEAVKAHPECKYNSFAPDTVAWLDAATMAEAWKRLYKEARHLENDPTYGPRMANAAMPLTMNLLERIDVLKKNRKERLPILQDVDALELIEWCARQLKENKVEFLSEIRYRAQDWIAKRPGDFTTPEMPFPNDGERPKALPEGTVWYGWDIERVASLGTTPDKVGVLDDSAACNGKAIRQPNTHNAWYLKMTKLPGGIYDLYVEAKCIPKTKDFKGAAFMFGNYPAGPVRDIQAQSLKSSEYTLVKLGRTHLTKAQYVWCAPVVNPTLKEFWIDRVILVPEF